MSENSESLESLLSWVVGSVKANTVVLEALTWHVMRALTLGEPIDVMAYRGDVIRRIEERIEVTASDREAAGMQEVLAVVTANLRKLANNSE